MKFFLFIFIFLSGSILARTNFHTPFIVGGVTAGALTGSQAAIYHSLMRMELQGWADKETGSTVKLTNSCDVEAEFHLVGNHRKNYLLLGVNNSTSGTAILQAKQTRFIFNGKRTRYPGFLTESQDYKLDSDWWVLTWIPFPSKDEFKEVDSLTVEVPILLENKKECVLTTHFTKKKKIRSEESSYSAFEFVFDGGSSLDQFGNIKRAGRPSGVLGFELNFYPRPQHGFGLIFHSENHFTKSKKERFFREFERGENYEARTSYVGIQYIYRQFLTSSLNFQYGIGVGSESLEDADEESVNSELDYLAFSQKLMLQWNFYQFTTPAHEVMDFLLGGGVVHIYNPGARLSGEHLDGHRLGLLLRFGMGF